MKIYKIELKVIDFDEIGEDCIKQELEGTKYSNHCISPVVVQMESRDIGEWHDDHPLNKRDSEGAEYQRLFAEPEKAAI